MNRPSFRLVCVLLALVATICVVRYRPAAVPSPKASLDAKAPAPGNLATVPPTAGPSDASTGNSGENAARRQRLEQFAYAQRWDGGQQPAEFLAFRDWSRRYLAAPAAARSGLEAEGIALARARREAMRTLMRVDPQRALALTVPAVVRQILPPAIVAELEQRVHGRGELALVARLPATGSSEEPGVRRMVVLNGQTYTGYVYGRRESQTAKDGISLHGIALDRELAVHESSLRLLEPGEVPAATAEPNCPVSDAPVPPLARGEGVNTRTLDVVEANGRIWEFCGMSADMLDRFAERLQTAEDGGGARGQAQPETAAEATTAWTTGTKQVLVIRIDFPDFPGEPVAQQSAFDTMQIFVRPYYENVSYGLTSIQATVSDKVYRMPQTGASYATGGNDGQMHTDARNAAAADYALANFDRLIVVFRSLGTAAVPGSLITFAGEAQVNGPNIWINGGTSFNMGTVSHELGHTYGLLHANLWKVTDGNPLSPAGSTLEYGDPFDVMGSTSVLGVSRDERFHFSPWHKNRLGWLPDAAVTTVTTSGTYRVYRFDSKNASRTQSQALRIFRDGVRWYWVGLRQSFATGSPQVNDAYIQWGFNNRQQSELLDLTTPGVDVSDAALAIGRTFTDSVSGISIKPVARGGAEPAQYLDVEVTVPGAPPNVLTSWGREGGYFFSGNTGLAASPAPETYVPFGLTNVLHFAAGDRHALALKSDGTVVAWGSNTNGQSSVPAGLTDVVAVAANANVSGVLKRDGKIQLWGDTTYGLPSVPSSLTNVKQLAIGATHALALRTDGTVAAWGDNLSGQASIPAGLSNVVAVAAGNLISVALKSDGTVARWGANVGSAAFPANLSGVVAISAYGQHVLALKNDGTVVAWGNNGNAQSNVPAGLGNVIAVAAGGFHSLALKSDGSVVGWGNSGNNASAVPYSLPRAYAIFAGNSASFALQGARVFITTQPESKGVATGGSTTFSVAVSASGPVSYQWRKDGVPISGATSATLTLSRVATADAGSYDVVVTESGNTTTSFPARLLVAAPIVITDQPRAQNVAVGGRATFGIETTGGGTIVYQWRKNGTAITGATNRTLTFNAVTNNDAGTYDVVLNDGISSMTSAAVQLTIVPVARIANLSIRTNAGTGAQTLIVGFVVGGAATTGNKALLLRGVGPSLGTFGVSGTLADPKLELYNGANKVNENDNWGGNSQVTSLGTQVGAFALSGTSSRDSALPATIASGGYSVQITGVGGTTGIALAEIYDATASTSFVATTPRLVNVSARTVAGSGADVLIAGFVIVGSTPKTILIRAIGPTLGVFGVSGTLADPKLELFNSASTKIQENDNWGGTDALTTAFTSVAAFNLPGTSRDAALLATLEPGNYTAQVTGVGGTTGVALIEVYEIPE